MVINNIHGGFLIIISLMLACSTNLVQPGSVEDSERRADSLFEKKYYNDAAAIWMSILDKDPANNRIKKKLESVTAIKTEKDAAFWKAQLEFQLAKKLLSSNNERSEGISHARDSLQCYNKAKELDPHSNEIQDFGDDMKWLEKKIAETEEWVHLPEKNKNDCDKLRHKALENMNAGDFSAAFSAWDSILAFHSKNIDAMEGRRMSKLAAEDRPRFEKLKYHLLRGKKFLDKKDYERSRSEFMQAISIDKESYDVKRYLRDIDERLEGKRLYKTKLESAEKFYKEGNEFLTKIRFKDAAEAFQNCLSIIVDYKDARKKLQDVDRLRNEYEKKTSNIKNKHIQKAFIRGLSDYEMGRYKAAADAFEEVLKIDNSNAPAREYLKRSREAMKND